MILIHLHKVWGVKIKFFCVFCKTFSIKKWASSSSKLRMNWANSRRNWRPKALKTARKWWKGGAEAGAKHRCRQVPVHCRCWKSWSCYGHWYCCWCRCQRRRRCRYLRFRRVLNVESSDASIWERSCFHVHLKVLVKCHEMMLKVWKMDCTFLKSLI